jgi:hypothetical protein
MRMRRLPCWFATAVVLVAHNAAAYAQVDADTLKAAFIYNFAVYTTWPIPLRDATTLTACVDRTSTLVPALRALAGKKVQARSFAVRETGTDASPDACDILIVAPRVPVAAPTVRGLLTVCDCNDERDASGATISLVREGDRLRFDVDRDEAAAAGLSLSSKLLRLARTAP